MKRILLLILCLALFACTEDDGVTATKDFQSQSKGPVTLKLGNVTASTVTFVGTLDVNQLGDYDMDNGGVGFIYTTTDETLNVSNAKTVNITTVDSNNEFSFTETGLPYDTRYHYTVFLYKNGICQYGSTQYFKTLPISVNIGLADLTQTTATFSGKIDLAGGSGISVGVCYFPAPSGVAIRKSFSDIDENGYYSVTVKDLTPETQYNYRYYIYQNGSYSYGNVQTFMTLDLSRNSAEDLSINGTANCYIVSRSGNYKFKAVKGNSTTSIGSAASAEVLWETFGTNVAPDVGDLIKAVLYKDGYIAFQTAETFKEGNAVIAAKNSSGTILWSWHIWFTDQPQGQVYYNNAGTMMDRNLGATSATPGAVGALGLLYQWGRKDPFLGSSYISDATVAKSTITWPSSVSSNSSNGTIAYATANPTTFITYNSSNFDWYYTDSSSTDNTRWTTSSSAKSIYDPCPAGWRVPDGGDNGVWSTAFGSGSDFDYSYNSSSEGMNFSGKFGSASTIWYPASGYHNYYDGGLVCVGDYGHYWSASPAGYYGDDEYRLLFDDDGRVGPSDDAHFLAVGSSVRCQKE